MLYVFGILISLVTLTATNNFHTVYRIFPESGTQVAILQTLENDYESNFVNISFWKHPNIPFRFIDVMVSPIKQNDFLRLMASNNFRYHTYMNDVEGFLTNTMKSWTRSAGLAYGWTTYHNLDEIYEWMHVIAHRYPQFIAEIEVGLSFEQQPIKGLKLSYGNESKPGIFVEGGIHPREWISPATVTYILNQLLKSNEKSIISMAENYDWYFFPVFNPDGYAFTHENPINVHNRLWRKTRSSYSSRPQNSTCKGADLNHNWSYKWNNAAGNGYICHENYAGQEAFSEFESRSIAAYITSISKKLFAYISFRGYGQTLTFPAEYTHNCKFDFKRQLQIAKKAVQVLKQQHGTEYTYGSLNDMAASGTGTSMQWIKTNFKLPLVFAYEMRDAGNYGFFLPPNQIIPNGEEVMQSLIALIKKGETYADFRKMISTA